MTVASEEHLRIMSPQYQKWAGQRLCKSRWCAPLRSKPYIKIPAPTALFHISDLARLFYLRGNDLHKATIVQAKRLRSHTNSLAK